MASSVKDIGIATLFILLGFSTLFAIPRIAAALGMEADMMCLPYVIPQCGCGKKMGPKGCVADPGNKFMCDCRDSTSGFTTTGKCVATFKCQAMGTSGKDGFGLDQIAKMLGDLMGKLMQNKGGDGAQPPPPPGGDPSRTPPTCSISTSNTGTGTASSTNATLTWQSTGEATSASISPAIGTVQPNGSQQVSVNRTTAYTMTVIGPAGTNFCATTLIHLGDGDDDGDQCSGIFAELYGCDDDDDRDDDTPTVELRATPLVGSAPLTVSFAGNSGRGGYTLDFGDGYYETAGCASGSCLASSTPLAVNKTHVYASGGTFTAKLKKHFNINEANCQGADCSVVDTVTIVVSGGTSTSTTTATTTTPTQPFSTTSPIYVNPAYVLPAGLRGDIFVMNSGGTILVGSRDTTRNTEIAGFYGSNTFSGPGTGVVATLCRNRPWSRGFLANIIPASFFDGLCSARGYQVGSPPPSQATVVTTTQTKAQPIKPATTTPKTSTTTPPAVAPRVRIWAVPSSVPLGSRTSIFWTSQGVASCIISSPDGSFSQTTLAGGASTVPLTQATTFTMSCLTSEGAPVTSYVTVNLAI